MAAGERILTLRVPAEAAQLQTIRQKLEQVLIEHGLDSEPARQLVVAVNEACMNIIQHAYRDRPAGDLILEVETDATKWLFRLKDFAPPIDKKRLKARDLSEVRPGGLGLPLIGKIMDEVSYPDPPKGIGNMLEMTKHRKP